MLYRNGELCDRISERLSEIRSLRDAVEESGSTEVHEMLIKNLDRMYLRLSEKYDEIMKK